MAMLRITTFNDDNRLSRAKAMLDETWGPSEQALRDSAEMPRLIEEPCSASCPSSASAAARLFPGPARRNRSSAGTARSSSPRLIPDLLASVL